MICFSTTQYQLHDNLLSFRDRNKEFELKGDFLKMKTNKNHNVDLASLANKNLLSDFAKEMYFDVKAPGKKSTRGRALIKLLKSPRLIISASGVSRKSLSKILIYSENPNEFCDRLKLLLQEKKAGCNSDLINQELVAVVDKMLEYNCISKKQHNQLLTKCNLIHE